MAPMFEVHLYGVVDRSERDHKLILEAADGDTAVKDAVRFFRNRQAIDKAHPNAVYWGRLGAIKAYSWAPETVDVDGHLVRGSGRPEPYYYEWKCDWGRPLLDEGGA